MPRMERKRGWIILAFFSLLFGCATTEDVRILDGEIYRLQSQVNGIQKEKDTGKGDLVAFRKEIQNGISALQAETQKLQTEAQRIKADFLLQKESLQSEMRTLSTQVEEYKEFLKRPQKEIDRVKEDVQPKLRLLEDKGKAYEERSKVLEDRSRGFEERMKRVEDRFKGLETKIGGLETKIGGLEAKTGELATKQMQMEAERPVPAKEKEPIPETRGVSTVVGDLYRDAYETYQKGNLEDARRRFEAFLKQYPNTELSDNAQFWIGETYYLKRDFEKAILEYEKAITKYPEGDKVPAALFKQALAFSELGDKTNARSTLRKVMERYPHSDQADMARKRLEAIK